MNHTLKTTKFQEKIYSKLKKVPKGKVITYKALAEAIGSKAYRAVGTTMKSNPYAPEVPCHRVVNSDGSIGGFASGVKKKIELLANEGIIVKNGKVIDFEKFLYKF